MDLNNLKNIKIQIGNEISGSMKQIGTLKMRVLYHISSDIDFLIELIENPEKHEKYLKSVNLGVKDVSNKQKD